MSFIQEIVKNGRRTRGIKGAGLSRSDGRCQLTTEFEVALLDSRTIQNFSGIYTVKLCRLYVESSPNMNNFLFFVKSQYKLDAKGKAEKKWEPLAAYIQSMN